MRCPECKGDVKVVDSASNANTVIRRRRCLDCDYVFYTTETVIFKEVGAPLLDKFKKDAQKA
jgi:transcriptional regulator NrdR family protein